MSLQDLVIVTGMSGSGKGTALKAFEDLGFFCIDNLPVSLIPKFIDGFHVSGGEVERAALVIDVRAGDKLRDLAKAIIDLKKYEFRLFVLYLEADEEILVRRFSETRRPHPLAGEKSLTETIRMERRRLRNIRELADVMIDTTTYSVHQMKALVMDRFRAHPRAAKLNLNLLSFGFKHGLPLESDLVFDVRFLPNPHFVAGLRQLTGRHKKVIQYMNSHPETKEFVVKVTDMLEYLVPQYIREGKSYLTVGIGCTGGRHRSVFIAEELARMLKFDRTKIQVRHRDEAR
jgi:RNase adapter protein RapZ